MNHRFIASLLFAIISIPLSYGICSAAVCGSGLNMALNGLRDGDVFSRYPITYIDTVSGGESCVWDLSNLNPGKACRNEVKLVNDSSERYRMNERHTSLYYERHGDTLTVAGHENNQWRLEFDVCEPWLTNSMAYGHFYSGLLHGKGIYCDRLRYAVRGSYRMGTDARGILILPEGDTLRNVQRVHTLRTFFHNYYPIDSANCDISMEELNKATVENRLLLHDTRRWYVSGYRYPLLEVQTLTPGAGGTPIMQQAYYTPASEMAELPADPDNRELRELIREGKAPWDGVRSNSVSAADTDEPRGGDDIRYRFDQNHGECTVSVRYTVGKPTDVEFLLADVLGFVYNAGSYHCEPGEEYSVSISYGSIPGAGPYVLYICTHDNRYAEKFNK